jgi:hypothetical protein
LPVAETAPQKREVSPTKGSSSKRNGHLKELEVQPA